MEAACLSKIDDSSMRLVTRGRFNRSWQLIDFTQALGASIFIWTLGTIKKTKRRRIIARMFNLHPVFL